MKLFRGDSSTTTTTTTATPTPHMYACYVIPYLHTRSRYSHVHLKTLNLIGACGWERRRGVWTVECQPALLWKASRRKIDLIRLMRLCKHEMLSDAVISTQTESALLWSIRLLTWVAKFAHTPALTPLTKSRANFTWNESKNKLFTKTFQIHSHTNRHIFHEPQQKTIVMC